MDRGVNGPLGYTFLERVLVFGKKPKLLIMYEYEYMASCYLVLAVC